jgi:hypothetical protein
VSCPPLILLHLILKLHLSIGDNFFKSASYMIEAICAESFSEASTKLKEVEARLLEKRSELRQFEAEYREVSLPFRMFACCCKTF